MKHPVELPIIIFRDLRWFVDVRLEELRQADTGDFTPLSFDNFESQATDQELIALINAILIYIKRRMAAE